MLSETILETTLMRLAINFGKFFKKGEKESYGNLFREYFPHVSDDDWIQAVEAYIRNPDHRQMPKVADFQVLLPRREIPESQYCRNCHKGLRSIYEKSQFEYWHIVTYACTCEAGKRYTAHAVWPCTNCPAYGPFKLPLSTQPLLMCRAYNFQPYNVNCLRWKKRLTKEMEQTKQTTEKKPHSAPDITEDNIPF